MNIDTLYLLLCKQTQTDMHIHKQTQLFCGSINQVARLGIDFGMISTCILLDTDTVLLEDSQNCIMTLLLLASKLLSI